MSSIINMTLDNNFLTFEDILPNIGITGISYSYQKNIPAGGDISVTVGDPLILSATVGGTGNVYQWRKGSANMPGKTTNTLSVASTSLTDAGTYSLVITNPAVPLLTLYTTDFKVGIYAPNASEDSGYTFWKKLGAETLGIPMFTPESLVTDNLNNTYIETHATDNSPRIQKLDASGNLLFTIDVSNLLGCVSDMSVDASNALYITSECSNNLVKYNSSGTFQYEIPNTNGTYGNAIDIDGSIVFLPRVGPGPFNLQRHNSATGAFIEQITFTGGPAAGIYLDVEVDAAGNFYASNPSGDPGNIVTIDKYSPTGTFISSIDLTAQGLQAWGGWHFSIAANGDIYFQSTGWQPSAGLKVYHFDNTGTFIKTFGNDILVQPFDLAITPTGILVADWIRGLVKFDTNGNFVGFLDARNANGQFSKPSHIMNDSKGNRYIADQLNHRIQKFDSKGNFLAAFGAFGSGAGQFNKPTSLAVDALDNVYVADRGNNRVQKFSSTGAHLQTIGTSGAGNGQFSNPMSLAISPGGFLYVADADNYRIQKFTPEGTYLLSFGSFGSNPEEFGSSISSIAIESDGNILVVDQNKIKRFSEAGAFINEMDFSGYGAGQLATDKSGYLYSSTSTIIRKLDKLGGLITNIGQQGNDDSEFMAANSVSSNQAGDTIWVSDDQLNRVSIFYANARNATTTDSLSLVELYNSTNGPNWITRTNWLTGYVNTWHGVLMSGGKIRQLNLSSNNLDGPLPPGVVTLDELLSLKLSNNKLNGSLPDWSGSTAMTDLDLSNNLFEGDALMFPSQLQKLDVSGNQLNAVALLPAFINAADLSGNNLTQLGSFQATHVNLDTLKVENNRLTFEDLEPNVSIPVFSYSPQDSVGQPSTRVEEIGETITIDGTIGGQSNQYQWKKNGTAIQAATDPVLTLNQIALTDDAFYNVEIKNQTLPALTLNSYKTELRVSSRLRDSLALAKLYVTARGTSWIQKSGWLIKNIDEWSGVTVTNDRVTAINLENNQLDGIVTRDILDMLSLASIDFSGNGITAIPLFLSLPKLTFLDVSSNRLDFASLLGNAGISGINYAAQAKLGPTVNEHVEVGTDYKVKVITEGEGNVYAWKRNDVLVPGAVDTTYIISSIGRSNMGNYVAEVTNPGVPNLVLKTNTQRVLATAKIDGSLFISASSPATAGQVTLFRITESNAYEIIAQNQIGSDGKYAFAMITSFPDLQIR
jgi:hypothetical protein